jgi:Icc-related predicted phosphoesterase
MTGMTTGHPRTVLALAAIHGDVESLETILDEISVDAVACVGDLSPESGSSPAAYRAVFKALGAAGVPAYWVPGPNDAPLAEYLRESYNGELVYEHLRGLHGSAAIGLGGHFLFAGMGGQIDDDPETRRAEERALVYPAWEAEYRLKLIRDFDELHGVLLFATPPAHKGLGLEGSEVLAELVNTYAPRLVVVGGDRPHNEVLGTSLVVCPGSMRDGRYAVVDVLDQTVEEHSLSAA